MFVVAGFAVSSKVNELLSVYPTSVPLLLQFRTPLVVLQVLSVEPVQIRAGLCATAREAAIANAKTITPESTTEKLLRAIALTLNIDNR